MKQSFFALCLSTSVATLHASTPTPSAPLATCPTIGLSSSQTSFNIGIGVGASSWNGKQNNTYKYVDVVWPAAGGANQGSTYKSKSFSNDRKFSPNVLLFAGVERRIERFIIGMILEGGYSFCSSTNSGTIESWQQRNAGFDRVTKPTISERPKWNAGVLGKVGFCITDRTSIYTLLGLQWQNFSASVSGTDNVMNYDVTPNAVFNGTLSGKTSVTPMGFVLGLGIKHKITQNFFMTLEGKWIQFSTKNYSINNPDAAGFAITKRNANNLRPPINLGNNQGSISGSAPRYGMGLSLKIGYEF